jgi:hypothetical protein
MKEMYENLLKSVDDWINTSRPKLDFDLREINFGLIRCYVRLYVCMYVCMGLTVAVGINCMYLLVLIIFFPDSMHSAIFP